MTDTNAQQPYKKERPAIITILGILFILGGLVSILIGGALSILSSSTSATVFLAVSAITGIFGIIGGIGLLKLKQWGLIIGILGLVVNLLGSLLKTYMETSSTLSGIIVSLIVNLSLIVYLYRNKALFD